MTGETSGKPSSDNPLAIRSYHEGPPWVFKGRALYQLHAVKSSVARSFVPPELKLVEAFGYTLGGLFFAHYDGSPAGQFDEAVAIAGIVWNPPTSCAWAGRVLVGSEEARVHGRKEVGLPSHLASFSHKLTVIAPRETPARPWWDARAWIPRAFRRQASKSQYSVEIVQKDDKTHFPLCDIVGIPPFLPKDSPSTSSGNGQQWSGLSVQLCLPNFSGRTKEQPQLLKYSCALKCRVSVVGPARVTDLTSSKPTATGSGGIEEGEEELRTNDVLHILKGKPLASIFFQDMEMRVEAPRVLAV